MSVSKIVAAAASSAGGAGLDVDEVFSTTVYDGTGSAQTITNGIDLSGEGGLVWQKQRNSTQSHYLFDTARGAGKALRSNGTFAEYNYTAFNYVFNSNGFSFNTSDAAINGSSSEYVSWTFRKAAKFFDVVTYTGNGTAGRTISHNLGSVPGMIIVKQYQAGETRSWSVYHRGIDSSAPEDYYLKLESTTARLDDVGQWNDTAPTSTEFTVGDSTYVNNNGESYVAYLFAHNNNDGGFGPTGSDDIIKCGSYTGNESADGPVIDLGFEPQWLLLKNVTSGYNFIIVDVMRGWSAGPEANTLFPNANNAEDPAGTRVKPTSTGFQIITSSNDYNKNGNEFIYMAIRRGPLATPTDATKVFAMDGEGGDGVIPSYDTTFPVDMVFRKEMNGSGFGLWDRIRGGYRLQTHNSDQQDGPFSYATFDHMDGFAEHGAVGNSVQSWMFKRAPGFFEQVLYTGTGSARTIAHPLKAIPQMIWCKRLDASQPWQVYHAYSHPSTPQNYFLELDADNSAADSSRWNNTAPTDSVFSLGSEGKLNTNNEPYIAYLFGEISGISKFGSYTGNGTGQNIDCGFSSGARFVLIKTTTVYRGWVLFDTYRGIVAGNDSYVMLNESSAQDTSKDIIDPYASGFAVSGSDYLNNSNGETYIFWAIA